MLYPSDIEQKIGFDKIRLLIKQNCLSDLAKEEIDVLLDKKIFVNAKRYNIEREEAIDIFNDDNLIIKGNNLLALHSLKEKYAGQIKLIYIDPPYNTGNDGFLYNDSYQHSSWMSFMFDRLNLSRNLMKEEGIIFSQIDEKEQLKTIAYNLREFLITFENRIIETNK